MATLALNPRGTVAGSPDPATLSNPVMVLGFDSSREVRTTAHAIIGSAEPSYTLRPAGPRSGTLRFLFDSYTELSRAENIHAKQGKVILTDPTFPGGTLTYIAQGSVRVVLDEDTRTLWVLETDFLEVS